MWLYTNAFIVQSRSHKEDEGDMLGLSLTAMEVGGGKWAVMSRYSSAVADFFQDDRCRTCGRLRKIKMETPNGLATGVVEDLSRRQRESNAVASSG